MPLKGRTRQALKQFEIGVIYFFGSQPRREQGQESDFDLAIVFLNPPSPEKKVQIHPILYNLLSQEFQPTMKQDLDIIYLQETAVSFQFEVISSGKILYEIDPQFRANYEEQVVKAYLDFSPVERIFSEALMERLS